MKISLIRQHLNKTSLVLALLAIIATTTALAQTNRDPLVTFQDYSKTRSESVYEQVERGLSTIPADIRKALLDSGYKILIAPTMTSGKPSLEGMQPGGRDPGVHYDTVGGQFDSNLHLILIPERVQSTTNSNLYLPNDGISSTIRHEMGHAYDYYQDRISQSEKFVTAYQADADRLRSGEIKDYDYFLQPDGRGYRELFAEIFAAAYTPNGATNDEYAGLLKAFPRTTALMMQLNPNRPKTDSDVGNNSRTGGPNDLTQTSQSSSPAVTVPTTAEQQRMMSLHKQLSEYMTHGKFVQAEPLMGQYVAFLEKHCCTSDPAATRLKETYLSYGDLLRRLKKAQEAQKFIDKARQIRVVTSEERQKVWVDKFKPGVVGLKFVLDPGHFPTVATVFPGGPAQKAGLLPKDEIIAIDGKTTSEDIKLQEMYDRITGTPGTSVKLTLRRIGTQQFTVTLTRVKLAEIPDAHARQDYLR